MPRKIVQRLAEKFKLKAR